MTTPQNQLHNLSCKIQQLTEMFKPNDGEDDVFVMLKQMQLEILDFMTSQQHLHNQMNLIIQLLSKDERAEINL